MNYLLQVIITQQQNWFWKLFQSEKILYVDEVLILQFSKLQWAKYSNLLGIVFLFAIFCCFQTCDQWLKIKMQYVNSIRKDSSNLKLFCEILTNETIHIVLLSKLNKHSFIKVFLEMQPAFDAILTFDWNVYTIGFMKTINQIEAFTY